MTALAELDQWLADMPEHWHLRDKVVRLRDKVAAMHERAVRVREEFDQWYDGAPLPTTLVIALEELP